MAQLVISAAGAAIGFAVGGPVGAQIGWAVGSVVGASVNRPKVQGPRLEDLKVGGSQYGAPIPRTYGSPRVPGQIWWASEKREVGTTTSQGKGGGPEVTNYTYEVDLLIGLADNEMSGITRIWSNGKLVWSRLTDADIATLDASFSSNLWRRMSEYFGSSNQLPDAVYEAAVGMTDAVGYRGRATVFFEGLQLGNSGQLPNLTFEIARTGSPELGALVTGPSTSGQPAGAANNWGTPASNSTRLLVYATQYTAGVEDSNAIKVYDIDMVGGTAVERAQFNTGTNPNSTPIIIGAGQGVSNEAIIVGIDGNYPLTAYGYTDDGSQVRTWTLSENLYPFCFVLTDAAFYVGTQTFSSSPPKTNRIYKHAASGGVAVAQSVAMTSYLSSMVVIGGRLYATSKYEKKMFVLDADTMALLETVNLPSFGSGYADTQPLLFDLQGELGEMGRTNGNSYGIYVRRNDAWVLLQALPVANFSTASNRSAFVVGNLLVCGQENASTREYDTWYAPITQDAECQVLADVVADVCAGAGLASQQFDTADLANVQNGQVCALAVTQVSAARSTLEQLAAAYFFEVSLRDKLYFRARAEDAIDSIPFADLAAAPDMPAAEPLALMVAGDLELPPQVAVTYANLLDDHQTGTEYSDRLISGQAAVQTVQLAMGLTPAQAKGVADAIIQDAAASLTSTTISLPLQYAHLEAGDVVTVLDEDDTAYRLRLVRKRDEAGVLAFEAVADDQSALTSAQVTDQTQAPGGTVTAPADTVFEPLDMPILRDADDAPGWYVAAKGSAAAWPGAQIQVSVDDVSFTTVAQVDESAVFGTCTTVLANYTGVGFDEVNSVTVNVGSGQLSSSTRAAMLADASVNAMLIGSEVIRFRTATLSSPGVYVLTGLLRGQRGTEWAMAGHAASERAVLLRPQGLRRVTTQVSEIGKTRYVRAVTLGTVATDVEAETFTDNGVALTPFSPVDARLEVLEGVNQTRIWWKRRTRLTAAITGPGGISAPIDYTFVPLSSPGSFLNGWNSVPTNAKATFVVDIFRDAARTNLFYTLYSDNESVYVETDWLQAYVTELPSTFEDNMLHVTIVHQAASANLVSPPLYATLNPLPS